MLSVAYPFAPVGADAVGGAEQVLWAVEKGVVEAGHRSVVVACEGSEVAGELVAVPGVPAGALGHAAVREAIARVLRRWPVDLVHLHGVDFWAYRPTAVPALVTLHLPPDWYPAEALRAPDVWFHGVSFAEDRALRAVRDDGWVLPPITNGVVVEAFEGPHARRGFALMLGRICPEKGQHLALQAARAAGVDLLLAGEVFPYASHQEYFRFQVEPMLGAGRRWIGPVGLARKRRLLAAARCVLIPSLVAETSSLVAMEAAASGTPVVAFRSGALPEVVEEGVTGFLVDDVAVMATAIGRVGEICPEQCRAVAAERFSARRMVAAYLERYAALVGR